MAYASFNEFDSAAKYLDLFAVLKDSLSIKTDFSTDYKTVEEDPKPRSKPYDLKTYPFSAHYFQHSNTDSYSIYNIQEKEVIQDNHLLMKNKEIITKIPLLKGVQRYVILQISIISLFFEYNKNNSEKLLFFNGHTPDSPLLEGITGNNFSELLSDL